MNIGNLSDVEIEILLFGKWRFDTQWEKIYIEFKDDMTYEQTRIQTFFLSKPTELVTGNKFLGVWYVSERKLCLTVKSVPKSFLNLQIPMLFSKISIADILAHIAALFITEKYQIIKINSSSFVLTDAVEKSFVGTKIN